MYELPPISDLPKPLHAVAQRAADAADAYADATTAAADAYRRRESREDDFRRRLTAAVEAGEPHTTVTDDRAQREADYEAAETMKGMARRAADVAWNALREAIAAHPEAAADVIDPKVEAAAERYRKAIDATAAARAEFAQALGLRSWWASATLPLPNPNLPPVLAGYKPAPHVSVTYRTGTSQARTTGNLDDALSILNADAAGLDALRASEAKLHARADHEKRAAQMQAERREAWLAEQEALRLARAGRN